MTHPKVNFESLRELLEADRSVRRFDESHAIDENLLRELVGLTRFCASGRNAQALRYRIATDSTVREALFPALAWAGYFKDWDGPENGQRPAAYLVQCLDTDIATDCLCDDGLQLQAITLGATAEGIAGCIIKAFNKATVSEVLCLPPRYVPRYVLALGYPAEKTKIVPMGPDGDFKYYRDSSDTHCVPKRSLPDLII